MRSRFRAVSLCSLLCACGLETAPEIELGGRCREADLEVQVEAGHPIPCQELLRLSANYRALFEERFGHQSLVGIPIRYRDRDFLDDAHHTGWRYADAIDLGRLNWAELPHELNHVRTGPGHQGWCVDFEPWSEEVLRVDERAYLGCR